MAEKDSRTAIVLVLLGITGISPAFVGDQPLNTPNCIKLGVFIFILGLGFYLLFQKKENTDTQNLPERTAKEKTNRFTSTVVVTPPAPFEFKKVISVIRIIAIIIFVIGFAITKFVSKHKEMMNDEPVLEDQSNGADTAFRREEFGRLYCGSHGV